MRTAESTGATRSTLSSRARNFALDPTKFNIAIVKSPLPESEGVLTPSKSCSLRRTHSGVPAANDLYSVSSTVRGGITLFIRQLPKVARPQGSTRFNSKLPHLVLQRSTRQS